MDLLRAGGADGAHFGSRGRSANDRILDDHDPLAGHHVGNDVELDRHGAVAGDLVGKNERPADEAVGDDPFLERDFGLLGEAERGGAAAVGHGHDVIGVDGRLDRQLPAHRFADDVHRLAENFAGRVGEIDVLEDAMGLLRRRETSKVRECRPCWSMRTISPGSISRSNVGADGVEGAGFAGHAPESVGGLPDDQRPHAPRIAAGLDPVGE